jgi:hypothetical protein
MPLGALFTTSDGEAIKDIPAGDLFLDFRNGTCTDSAGTVTLMNTNLDYYGLTQCNSFAVFASDADTGINVGNALTISDHQLTHVIESYAFDQIRLSIPSNSTPDATNQIMFVASTNLELNYVFNNYAHFRDNTTGTTTNSFATYVSHHVGGYDQFHFIISNTDSTNSLDVKVQFSENGSDWFDAQGYTAASGVTVAAGSYNSFSSENTHHFYRVRLKSTSSGNHATFQVFWNYVSMMN